MSTLEILTQKVDELPAELQREVVFFVDYLLTKYHKNADLEDKEWAAFSMQNVFRGFEDDPVTYSKADIVIA